MDDHETFKLLEDAQGLQRHLRAQGCQMDAHTVGQLVQRIRSLQAEMSGLKARLG